MSVLELERIIEALLYVSGEAIAVEKIAFAIEKDVKYTKKLMRNLICQYESEARGMVILEIDDAYQMCTNPIYFDYVKKLYETPTKKQLSQSLMETLAIIAYKQPITKGQIEEIRGVNSDHSVNKLIEYRLVSEKGRLDIPGKPVLFGTTEEFLKYFGYQNLSALPPIPETESPSPTFD